MLQIWGKIMQRSQMLDDYVAESKNEDLNINQQLMECMEELCHHFDLPKPIWLDQNYDELNKYGKTAFRQDHFIESVPFTEFEIIILDSEDN